ncbi:MAG: TonB-dependent receptor [Sphingomonas bacterium]|nr:TonB-dependent receptor [Sphingomonas bacterium]
MVFALSGPLAAQSNRSSAYDAAFFAPFSPQSALDIAQRVPGFALDEGNSGIRGFAGAAGNVVFNGARPSSKSESLTTLLARIPASRVVRVELGPGDLYGSEYSGKSQVVNVILSADSGIDGTVTASLTRRWNGTIVPNLSASALIKRGQSSFSLSAGTGHADNIDEGTDKIADPVTGELFEKRRKRNHYRPRSPFVSAGWALEQAPDKAIHLNARFDRFTEDFDQINLVYPTGEDPRDDRLYLTAKSPGYEIGGDVSRPLAGGAIKFVALANRRKRENLDTVEVRDDGDIVGGFEQGSQSQRNETIGRLNWTRGNLGGFSVETGAEVALNSLDYRNDLFILGPDGERTRIDLPIDDATVKETRGEVYVKAGKQMSKALRIDAGLNYEMSSLKVRGDTSADRSLRFLKPSITLDWKPGGGWHSQFTVRRTVAQLDFFDFISSAELSNDRVNGGNANLLPQRAWEVRATLDHPLFKTGLIKLDAGYDRIELLQDRILVFDDEGNAFDAPGNIGTGTRGFIALAIDAPLDRFGIKGGRLKLNGQLQRTRVLDPISGEKRSFTGFYPEWQWSAEFRRDIGKFAYGLTVSDRDRYSFFRANEIDTVYNGGIFGNAFVEYRPNARTTATFEINNLFDTRGLRTREFTFPNRSLPDPSLIEFRERNSHVSVAFSLKRSFGGADKATQTGAAAGS